MRTTPRPFTTSLMLLGAMALFAGCGDQDAHLPAGMSGASSAYSGSTGVDVLDDVIDGDPGGSHAGVSSMADDPVLAGYDGVDGTGGLGIDDPYSRAVSDWNETEGSLGGLDDLDPGMDDGMIPAGYGGYGDGYGYGGDVLGMGLAGGYGGYGNVGVMDAGMMDAGFDDPGFVDPGFEDPGFDAGFTSVGFDPGLVDPGIDAGVVDAGMDAGFVDPGFDAGVVDTGFADVGGFDAGIGF